jgi:hypothetical protein
MAANAGKTAAATGAGYGTSASGISDTLVPQLNAEATGNIGYTPQQQNNMLVAGEQGAGGANAGIAGQAGLQVGRTRNSAATSGVLDEAARDKTRQMSTNALGVANESANLAQKKQAGAQSALEGLYGTDVSAQLRAMGLIPEDVNADTNAGSQGWLQNATGVIKALGSLGGGGR